MRVGALRSLNLRKMRVLLAVLATLAAGPAAAGWELGAGRAQRVDGERAGLATVSYLTAQPRFPWEFMVGYIDSRQRSRDGSTHDQLLVGASKRWNVTSHFYGSVGVALNSDDTDVLSGHLQFQSALGWRSKRFGISLRHLSNASITGANRGETFVLVQVAL